MMFYPVQEFDYYRDVNHAPFVQDGPIQIHTSYALRSDLATTVAWIAHSGDAQMKSRMRRAIRITFVLRLLMLALVTSLVCVGLQLVIGTFSAYIFWVVIIVLALAFSQLMSLSRYLHILSLCNDTETVTYTMDPEWAAPPPPPTYSRATAVPPAYESPKPLPQSPPTFPGPNTSLPQMSQSQNTSLAQRLIQSVQSS